MSEGYIGWLKLAIRNVHNCEAEHIETVPVHEQFQGETVWQGEVEVFRLSGHPKASLCYALGTAQFDGGNDLRAVTVLGLPPVDGPLKAIQVFIVGSAKGKSDAKSEGKKIR